MAQHIYSYLLKNGKTMDVSGDTEPSVQEAEALAKERGFELAPTDPQTQEREQRRALMNNNQQLLAKGNERTWEEQHPFAAKVLAFLGDRPGESRWGTSDPERQDIGSRYVDASTGRMVKGAQRVAKGEVAGGAHDVINGGMALAAPFALPAAVVTAPLATGLALGGGALAGAGTQAGAEMLGATPDQTALAGDIGGLVGGGLSTRGAGPVRAAAQAARGPVAGGLNLAAAALDNPVAGAMSPRAPHVGKMAAGLAEAIQPKPKVAPPVAPKVPTNAGGRVVTPAPSTTPTAIAQDALAGLQAPEPAPVGTLPPPRTAPPQQFRTSAASPSVPNPSPLLPGDAEAYGPRPAAPNPANLGGRLTGDRAQSFEELLAEQLGKRDPEMPTISTPPPLQAPPQEFRTTRGPRSVPSEPMTPPRMPEDAAYQPVKKRGPTGPPGTPVPPRAPQPPAGVTPDNSFQPEPDPTMATPVPETGGYAAGSGPADPAAELLKRGIGVSDETAATAPVSQTTATGRASRARPVSPEMPGEEEAALLHVLGIPGMTVDALAKQLTESITEPAELQRALNMLHRLAGGGA